MTHRSKRAGQRTGGRILDAALELFNRDGTGTTTTNHIAAHLGISPGNLYYWYPDKRAIVRALWTRYTSRRAALWEVDDLPAPGEVLERLGATAALGREYLFLARDLPALAHEDPVLREAVAAERARRLGTLGALARTWRADGLLHPVTDERLDALVAALDTLAESWLPLAPPGAVGEPSATRTGRPTKGASSSAKDAARSAKDAITAHGGEPAGHGGDSAWVEVLRAVLDPYVVPPAPR